MEQDRPRGSGRSDKSARSKSNRREANRDRRGAHHCYPQLRFVSSSTSDSRSVVVALPGNAPTACGAVAIALTLSATADHVPLDNNKLPAQPDGPPPGLRVAATTRGQDPTDHSRHVLLDPAPGQPAPSSARRQVLDRLGPLASPGLLATPASATVDYPLDPRARSAGSAGLDPPRPLSG